jgi:glycosyltransferase involved in cell wall biosynthesis
MSGKRILIVTSELVPFHYGGIGTQFKSLVAFLRRQGHQVSLLARKPENYNERIYRSHYGETPLFFIEAPSSRTGPPQHFIYAAEVARRFDEIYPQVQPDLVIFADFNAEGFFLLLRLGDGAYGDTQFLLTINGMNAEVIAVREGDGWNSTSSLKHLPHIRTLLAMEDLCVHLAPRIVSPTVCAWEEVRQRLDLDKSARVIPNLVDLDLFRPEMSGAQEEKREPLILFVGRLDRMKGADLLLKAYLKIADGMYPVVPRIVFIGRDCYWNEYGSTFLEYWKSRIPERYDSAVMFTGQVRHDEIREYLKKASVAVFPSRWEPFGIVCLEALSMGCPVVVSSGTGFEEVLGPVLAEFAVPVKEDPHPLARKILDVLNKNIFAAPEKLQERSLEVVRQAEAGWLDLLRDINMKDRVEEACAKPLCDSLHRLLASIEDSWRGTVHLQIYFRRRGGYDESDSFRVPYSRLRWTTLEIPLPQGVDESPLRLDPADAPGAIRIREILLLDEAGTEIWRANGANHFQGCSAGGNDLITVQDSCLFIDAIANDPQIFLDCPTTGRPLKISVTLCASDA